MTSRAEGPPLFEERVRGFAKTVVYANGVRFPTRTGAPGHVRPPSFVPFSDIAWVFADPANPVGGIKVGVREGWVRRIPPRLAPDLSRFLEAVRALTNVVTEDPEMQVLLRKLDAIPDAYGRLWRRRDVTRPAAIGAVGLAFVFATAILMLGILAQNLDRFLVALGIAITVLAAGTVLGLKVLKAIHTEAMLTLVDADKAPVFALFDRFFQEQGLTVSSREWARFPIAPQRRYTIPSQGTHVDVVYNPGGESSSPMWLLLHRARMDEVSRHGELESALGRFALKVGLKSPDSASVREILGERVQAIEKLAFP